MTDLRARLADAVMDVLENDCGLDLITSEMDVPCMVADALLSLPGIAIVETDAAVMLRLQDGWWELTYSNGRNSRGKIGDPAVLLTACLVEGDQVTVKTKAAANETEGKQ